MRWEKKIKPQPGRLKKWFAWYPVKTESYPIVIVWLEWVIREKINENWAGEEYVYYLINKKKHYN